jgi:glycosyltransferase involved in cell wall biosynthesis
VIIISDASDNELVWLYRNCLAFLFPSLAEGWGMPVTEAVGFGKPVIVSDRTSVPEATLGFGQVLPLDVDAWVNAIAKIAAGTDGTDAAAAQAAVAARSWDRCVSSLIDHLQAADKGSRRRSG